MVLGIFVKLFLLMLLLCPPLLAQNDFLADNVSGTLIGLSYLSQSDNDGYWLTTGYTTDGKFNIGGNFGRIKFSPGESAWIFEPVLSYIILKPLTPWKGLGSKLSISARFYILESEQLQQFNLNATDRSYKLTSSIFYNYDLSAKFILQPELYAGVSFRRLKVWNSFGFTRSFYERDPIVGLGVATYLTFSDSRSLQFRTHIERVGGTTSYIFSLNYINEWSGNY